MPAQVGIAEAIDRVWEANEKGPRPHLGASQIGKPCERMLVYSFRHAVRRKNEGRMLRLWNRGHREEPSLIASLRMIGFEIREFAQRLTILNTGGLETYAAREWDDELAANEADVTAEPAHVECAGQAGVKLRQWNFSDIGGHHAGSGDGKAMNPSTNLRQFPSITPDTWFNLEFKTYGKEPFSKLLVEKSVQAAKPEHFDQMQEYMHYLGLPFSLYLGICKNDDRIYDEVVPYDRERALKIVEKARRTVAARQLPRRFSDNATNFECRFCDYKTVCHFGEQLLKSCRTCRHVAPITEGDGAIWHCGLHGGDIPKNYVPVGCDSWAPLTD